MFTLPSTKGLDLQSGACGAILSFWGPAYFQGVFLMSFREFFDGFHHQTYLLFECEVFTFFEDFQKNPKIPLERTPMNPQIPQMKGIPS